MARHSIAKPGSGNDSAGANRQTRGIELFQDGAFERISRDVYIVQGPKSNGEYTVNLERVTCTCKDFEHHGHVPAFVCKHLIGAFLYREWIQRSAKIIAPIFGGDAA